MKVLHPVACAVLILAPVAAPFARGADQPAPGDPVLELPKLTVTDPTPLPELEKWSYTRLGDFDVLSNAGLGTTQRLLADFARFRHAVSLAWPAPVKPIAASSLILCGRDNKFDAFRPDGADANGALVPSLFLRDREQIAIIVDLQLEQVAINDPIALQNANANAVEYQVDHYRQLYREYILYLLSQREVRPPPWLEEGVAQIVMDIDLTDQSLILGKIETTRGGATGGSPLGTEDTDATVADAVVGEQPFNTVLQHQVLMPFGQFFAITADAPEAHHPLGNNLWAKQAYAFVHFCLFGENLRYKDALATFVSRLAREPLSEELFKECFKVDYAGMKKQLRAYILYTKHKYQRYELKKSDNITPASIVLDDATPAQIGLLKGDALRLGGHVSTAFGEYRAAYERGAREPALLAGLGATATDATMARKFTDEAVRNKVNRPSAYVTQARARLADFKADPGPDGKLTPVQMTAVLTPLFAARNLPPPLPATYELIAEAWAASSVPAKSEHLGVLDEGVRRFPRDSDLLYRTARLYQQAGSIPTALAITELGLRFATDSAAKARLEELQASLTAKAK